MMRSAAGVLALSCAFWLVPSCTVDTDLGGYVLRCGPGGACPEGFFCAADERCRPLGSDAGASSDGGAPIDGGSSDGGAPIDGGSSDGGRADGGLADGGLADGGGFDGGVLRGAIAAGNGVTCALEAGRLYCWGDDSYGSLGDNDETGRQKGVPGPVVALPANIARVAMGGVYVCATNTDGGASCWGITGAGATARLPQPQGALHAVTDLAIGSSHACAVHTATAAGTVSCWGDGADDRLGYRPDGGRSDHPTNLTVPAAVRVACGDRHTCVIAQTGEVLCWGANDRMQLGVEDAGAPTRLAPVTVPTVANAKEIAAGDDHTCALQNDGRVFCWGANGDGRLGRGSMTDAEAPAAVRDETFGDPVTGVDAIAAGREHTCLLIAGNVRCMGNGVFGRLGTGTSNAAQWPTDPVLTGAVAIAAGSAHTCARLANGGIRCWGANRSGELGIGPRQSATPVITAHAATFIADYVAAGADFTCAGPTLGSPRCWGNDESGQLGAEWTTPSGVYDGNATRIDGFPTKALSAGASHACALDGTGAVACWGSNSAGILGQTPDMLSASSSPVTVLPSGGATAMSATFGTACAIRPDGGALRCWGAAESGQIGRAADGGSIVTTPVDVLGMLDARQVATGGSHTCAIVGPDRLVKCWGSNDYSELGRPFDGGALDLPAGAAIPTGASDLAAGFRHNCAVTAMDGGMVYCWGYARDGALGSGTTNDSSQGVVAVNGGASSVAAGAWHSCALMGNGDVRCWGQNAFGQAGVLVDGGMPARVLSPVRVPLPRAATRVVAGDLHTCAALTDGGVACWGQNVAGQLGDGDPLFRLTPTPVAPRL